MRRRLSEWLNIPYAGSGSPRVQGDSALRGLAAVNADLACAVLIFVIATVGCWSCLTAFHLTSGREYAVADVVDLALPVATGHGMVALQTLSPAIKDFLDKKTLSLDPRDYPKGNDLTSIPLWGEKFAADRYFLVYTIAFFWRIFGISWPTLNILAAVVYGMVAAIVFGIFRLGMGRILGVAGTVLTMLSPVVLCEVLALRDFCKAPFILATILLCGHLLVYAVSRRRLLAIASVWGLIIGIGVGFRQDSIICLPPAVLFILVFAQGKPRLTLRTRLAATVLLLACFLLPAFPALRMTSRTGGNNAFYLTQGFASPCLRDLDMTRASYAPIYTCADYITYAYIDTFAREQTGYAQGMESLRTLATITAVAEAQCTPASPTLIVPLKTRAFELSIWSKGEELVARRYFYELVTTFPADTLTRWYAAALRVVRNLDSAYCPSASNLRLQALQQWGAPVAQHLYRFGLFYVAATFLVLSGIRFRLALGAAFLLLFFCGYPSLEFQVRHAFHLNFASFWFPGFLIECLIAAAWRRRTLDRACLAPAIRRVALFAALCVILACAPLYAARAIQQVRVDRFHTQYSQAQLDPLPVAQHTDANGGVQYVPASFPSFESLPPLALRDTLALLGLPVKTTPDVLAEYVVAELETTQRTNTVRIGYENPESGFDATEVHEAAPGVFRFFFPVFHFTQNFYVPYWTPASTFKGLSLSPGARLKGFYRVRNREDFPFLMNVWLPSDPAEFQGYYGLKLLTR